MKYRGRKRRRGASLLRKIDAHAFVQNVRTQNLNSISDNYTDTPDANQTLNINGKIINIGGTSSIVNILGTTTYVATNELSIHDKMINLNTDQYNNAFDNGANSGFQIKGTSGDGFIQTSNDATRYLIKPPAISQTSYILTVDNSYFSKYKRSIQLD
jgi:hypothetical protein